MLRQNSHMAAPDRLSWTWERRPITLQDLLRMAQGSTSTRSLKHARSAVGVIAQALGNRYSAVETSDSCTTLSCHDDFCLSQSVTSADLTGDWWVDCNLCQSNTRGHAEDSGDVSLFVAGLFAVSTLGHCNHCDAVCTSTATFLYVGYTSHVPKQLFFTVAGFYQLMCDKLSTAAHQETRRNPFTERITKNNMWRMAWQFYRQWLHPLKLYPILVLYCMIKRRRYHAHAATHTLVDSIDFTAPFYCGTA